MESHFHFEFLQLLLLNSLRRVLRRFLFIRRGAEQQMRQAKPTNYILMIRSWVPLRYDTIC